MHDKFRSHAGYLVRVKVYLLCAWFSYLLNCIYRRSLCACVCVYDETRSSVGQRYVKLIPPLPVSKRLVASILFYQNQLVLLCSVLIDLRSGLHVPKNQYGENSWHVMLCWNMHTKLNALSLQRNLIQGLSDWQVVTSTSWSRFFPLFDLLSLLWMLSSLFFVIT